MLGKNSSPCETVQIQLWKAISNSKLCMSKSAYEKQLLLISGTSKGWLKLRVSKKSELTSWLNQFYGLMPQYYI